jgi:hypothetical protein
MLRGLLWRNLENNRQGRESKEDTATGKFGGAWWGMFNCWWIPAECFVVTSSELLIAGSRRFGSMVVKCSLFFFYFFLFV